MFVFCNLAMSLDGKIATKSRALCHLGTSDDRRHMQALRRRCDAVLMGASTLRAHKGFCGVRGAARQPANVILSSRLDGVSPSWPFFSDPRRRRILFVTESLPPGRRRLFERSCEIIPLAKGGARRPVAQRMIDTLGKLGFQRLLVEGGGGLMWDFASVNRIDEYHITLTPKIIGGVDAPTLVEGAGFAPSRMLSLRLARCRRLGDELYLTYRPRTGFAGPRATRKP